MNILNTIGFCFTSIALIFSVLLMVIATNKSQFVNGAAMLSVNLIVTGYWIFIIFK